VSEASTVNLGTPIWGFDISNHQGPSVDFERLKREGYEFCFIKASEGIGWWDPHYKTNMRRAREAGLQAGAYHFLWGNDPIRQVQTFLNRVGNPDGKMLCVDVETYNGQVPPRKVHLWGFLRELTRRVGKQTPIVVYSGDWYYVNRPEIGNAQFSELEAEDIEVAPWSTPNVGYAEGPGTREALYGQMPETEWQQGFGFGGKPIHMLQFTAEGGAAGISPLDLNAFAGTQDELRRLVFPSTTTVAKGPDDDEPPEDVEVVVGLHTATPNFTDVTVHGPASGLTEEEETEPDTSDLIVLQPGPEHDPGFGLYVQQHPTHYNLREDVRRLAEKYINMPQYRGRVWANTYNDHPPGMRLDAVSVDFWDWSGRAHPLADAVHAELYRTIFEDPEPPFIRWIISNGRMWTPSGYQAAPWGPPGSDAGHFNHIHCTFR
jgi:GH25 family lysozyme M1 (1,4-beta-N-acetylmuramidase)